MPARVTAGPKVREWSRKNGLSDFLGARFVKAATDSLGEANVGAALDGLRRKPPSYLRANPLRLPAEEVKRRLTAKGFLLASTNLDPNVFRIRQAPLSPGATVEHMKGQTTPQDVASASVGVALQARPGDVVADLAAAPGIKTLHVAGDLAGQGAIVAVEPDAERMRALRFTLERCGVTTAVARLERAQDTPGQGWADKVLVDAPCSGEGTIPKDPNRRRVTAEEIDGWCTEQAGILDAAHRILKPGGILVYATCTFAPEENEAHVQTLLDRGYKLEALPFDRVGDRQLGVGITQWPDLTLSSDLKKCRRFWPGLHPTLGFFVARLRKGGQA